MLIQSKTISSKVKLPNQEEIDIRIIPEVEKLEQRQIDFLSNYLASNLQATLSRLRLGIKNAEWNEWQQNTEFTSAFETVKLLYTESLRATHLYDSFTNSKIRTKTLSALDAEGFQDKKLSAKNQQINFFSDSNSMADLIESVKKLTQ
jgi:hypothetical protein